MPSAEQIQATLASLDLQLPPVATPLAAYVPAVRQGDLVYTSGQLPTVDGELLATGVVGQDVTVEQAQECAQQCALNALAAVQAVAGDLSRVERIVKVVGFVASAPDFTGQPAVINACSELLGAVFGDQGVHARSAVGVAALPLGAPVEIEMVVALTSAEQLVSSDE